MKRRVIAVLITIASASILGWCYAVARGVFVQAFAAPAVLLLSFLLTPIAGVLSGVIPAIGLLLAVGYFLRWRGLRKRLMRWNQDQCPGCGYAMMVTSPRCPECGSEFCQPAARDVRYLVSVAIAFAVGWPLGAIVGEVYTSYDEHRFRQEVYEKCVVGGADSYARARAWPAGNTGLGYSANAGYWTTD
jgi:hypothetical protein